LSLWARHLWHETYF